MAHRAQQKAIGCGGQRCAHVDAKAVHHVAAGHAAYHAVAQAGQLEHAGRTCGVVAQFVVAGFQLRRVLHRHTDRRHAQPLAVHARRQRHSAGIFGIGGRREHLGQADRKDRPARSSRLLLVQPQGLLPVHGTAHGGRHLAEHVACDAQVVVLKPQQAADGAACHQRVGQTADRAAVAHTDLQLARVVFIGGGHQRAGLATQHQRLPAADEQAQRTIAGRNRADLHLLAQLAQHLVALVQQVVGRVARTLGRGDLRVQVGEAGGQRIDLGHRRLQVVAHAVLQRVELPAGAAKAGRHFFGTRQHHLASRAVLRLVGHVDEGVKELVGRVADAGFPEREYLLEFLQLGRARGVGTGLRARQPSLARQKIIVLPAHGAHVDALAEIARPAVLRRGRGQLDRLARIAHGVGIGDVVADHLQRRLVGEHRACSDAHQVRRHGCFLRSPRAAGARWC